MYKSAYYEEPLLNKLTQKSDDTFELFNKIPQQLKRKKMLRRRSN